MSVNNYLTLGEMWEGGKARRWVLDPPCGDDPQDQEQIKQGYANAMKWMSELRRKCGLASLRGAYENYEDNITNQIQRDMQEGAKMGTRWWDKLPPKRIRRKRARHKRGRDRILVQH